MSRENVELVRRAYETWNRDDIDEMMPFVHPDFEFLLSGLFPGIAPVYRGREGWGDFWRDFRAPWESLRVVVDELRDADERVVVLFRWEGRGRDGVEVCRPFGSVWTVRDGLIIRLQGYPDGVEALEAAGLDE